MRVIKTQSVAEHSYFVTCYGLEIAKIIGWPEGAEEQDRYQALHRLAMFLLRHDENETFESDVPGPVKKIVGFDNAKLKNMGMVRFGPGVIEMPGMKEIKRAADLMDEAMYLAGEVKMGNHTVANVLRQVEQRLMVAVDDLPTKDKRRIAQKLQRHLDMERSAQKNLEGLQPTIDE